MSESSKDAARLKQAVEFFQAPARARLLEAIYHKYISFGRVGGQIHLKDCSYEERLEIASFLGQPLSREDDVLIRLVDFQKALLASSFACELPALLQASFPDRSLLTRPQQRARQFQQQATFIQALQSILHAQPPASHAAIWLGTGKHGISFLLRRYKNASPAEQSELLETVVLIAQALNQLPTEAPVHYQRLALFARQISGDPHFFDINIPSGRLFYQALIDLRQEPLLKEAEDDEVSSLDLSYTKTDEPLPEPERLLVYYEAGLLLDTISSNVAIYHLAGAERANGQPDAIVSSASEDILLLPLRQIIEWTKVFACGRKVYLLENPPVFEDLVDHLHKTGRPLAEHPTLICTAGWPSSATMRLLSLLIETQPELTLYYSGDFDVQGLRIATYFLERYPHHLQLWHFDEASYQHALHERSQPMTEEELAAIEQLPLPFANLNEAIQQQGQKAYQEGLTAWLFSDL
ncbi:TIGR02679 family protein [Tengunoibacter tsumagoiensis]|nr:TIGR02679 family protein [Tengunoibacter tsumagoiensis]